MNLDNILFHWNVGPDIFSIGPLTVRWYGLLFAAAFLIGLQIMHWIYKREQRNEQELDSLFIYILAGTIIGARLGHVLFYAPGYYADNLLEVLMIWKGGLASHGGAAGILIAVILYTRKQQHPGLLWVLDRFCMTGALGGFFIRMGNFFNSEIIGTPVNGGIVFDHFDSLPRHPVQLYEAVTYLLIFVILFSIYRRFGKTLKDGRLLGIFLILVFTSRFGLEFFKIPQAHYGQDTGISVGQWLSVPFIIYGVVLIIMSRSSTKA